MKQIIPIILMISLIGIASAIYPGESITYLPSNFGMNDFTNVTITNNISEIDYDFGYDWVNITIPEDVLIQSFTITFSGYKNNQIVQYSGTPTGGGGGLEFVKPKAKKTIINETTPLMNQTTNTTIVLTPEEPATKEFFLWTWLKWVWNKLTFWRK